MNGFLFLNSNSTRKQLDFYENLVQEDLKGIIGSKTKKIGQLIMLQNTRKRPLTSGRQDIKNRFIVTLSMDLKKNVDTVEERDDDDEDMEKDDSGKTIYIYNPSDESITKADDGILQIMTKLKYVPKTIVDIIERLKINPKDSSKTISITSFSHRDQTLLHFKTGSKENLENYLGFDCLLNLVSDDLKSEEIIQKYLQVFFKDLLKLN